MKHEPLFGCDIKWLEDRNIINEQGNEQKDKVIINYCNTHKVELCRCGHEWGKHPFHNEIPNIDRLIKAVFKN